MLLNDKRYIQHCLPCNYVLSIHNEIHTECTVHVDITNGNSTWRMYSYTCIQSILTILLIYRPTVHVHVDINNNGNSTWRMYSYTCIQSILTILSIYRPTVHVDINDNGNSTWRIYSYTCIKNTEYIDNTFNL